MFLFNIIFLPPTTIEFPLNYQDTLVAAIFTHISWFSSFKYLYPHIPSIHTSFGLTIKIIIVRFLHPLAMKKHYMEIRCMLNNFPDSTTNVTSSFHATHISHIYIWLLQAFNTIYTFCNLFKFYLVKSLYIIICRAVCNKKQIIYV